uniref:Serine and arginine rich splicing factor 11 n=1 Tax=Crocodylus porosus TaxID=8502 RepID=A0A7M4F203_CROPO
MRKAPPPHANQPTAQAQQLRGQSPGADADTALAPRRALRANVEFAQDVSLRRASGAASRACAERGRGGLWDTAAQAGCGGAGGSAMASSSGTDVIQVTNVSPSASSEQMRTLFGFLGKIEELRLFPPDDSPLPVSSRVCFVKFHDPDSAVVAQHLTNTVFVDRALIVVPYAEVFHGSNKAAVKKNS